MQRAEGQGRVLRVHLDINSINDLFFYPVSYSLPEKLVLAALQRSIKTARDLQLLKNEFSAQTGKSHVLNLDLVAAYRQLLARGEIVSNEKIYRLFIKRGVRTLSGVATVSVLTKPYPCPGNCLFCPTEKAMPKSYLSNEPAVQRAILNQFDAFSQVQNRLFALETTGHAVEKVEIIVMGGTFSYLPRTYQTAFIRQCFHALNTYPQVRDQLWQEGEQQNAFAHFDRTRLRAIPRATTLQKAIKANERAACRCVGLTLETRPDYITPAEIKRMRKLGCTRVELGVQTIYDDVLTLNRRGHLTAQTITATRLLKDAGFKITYHLMPGLYGSSLERDLAMFREIFTNPVYQPDQLKIYPTVVAPYSDLEQLFREGKYQPLETEELVKLLVQVKAEIIPPYCRITRLIRDIPEESIIAGNKVTNLRQRIAAELQARNQSCSCTRCREVRGELVDLTAVQLVERQYLASGGTEYFLSFEDSVHDKLLALLRLRVPGQSSLPELKNTVIVREVHSYGQQIALGQKGKSAQHLGLGKKLLAAAEKIAQRLGYPKIAVISGVGVREYYEKQGYCLAGTYMVKSLTSRVQNML